MTNRPLSRGISRATATLIGSLALALAAGTAAAGTALVSADQIGVGYSGSYFGEDEDEPVLPHGPEPSTSPRPAASGSTSVGTGQLILTEPATIQPSPHAGGQASRPTSGCGNRPCEIAAIPKVFPADPYAGATLALVVPVTNHSDREIDRWMGMTLAANGHVVDDPNRDVYCTVPPKSTIACVRLFDIPSYLRGRFQVRYSLHAGRTSGQRLEWRSSSSAVWITVIEPPPPPVRYAIRELDPLSIPPESTPFWRAAVTMAAELTGVPNAARCLAGADGCSWGDVALDFGGVFFAPVKAVAVASKTARVATTASRTVSTARDLFALNKRLLKNKYVKALDENLDHDSKAHLDGLKRWAKGEGKRGKVKEPTARQVTGAASELKSGGILEKAGFKVTGWGKKFEYSIDGSKRKIWPDKVVHINRAQCLGEDRPRNNLGRGYLRRHLRAAAKISAFDCLLIVIHPARTGTSARSVVKNLHEAWEDFPGVRQIHVLDMSNGGAAFISVLK